MITKEEYLKAKAIVDEYECDESDEEEDEDDILERRENESFERALNCDCGAWVLSQDKTKVLHVADCICGAE